MTENCNRSSGRVVVSIGDRTPEKSGYSQRRIVVTRHCLTLDHFGLPICVQVHANCAESANVREDALLLAKTPVGLQGKRGPHDQTGLRVTTGASGITTWTEVAA